MMNAASLSVAWRVAIEERAYSAALDWRASACRQPSREGPKPAHHPQPEVKRIETISRQPRPCARSLLRPRCSIARDAIRRGRAALPAWWTSSFRCEGW